MSDMWQAAVSQIVSLSETVEHRQHRMDFHCIRNVIVCQLRNNIADVLAWY